MWKKISFMHSKLNKLVFLVFFVFTFSLPLYITAQEEKNVEKKTNTHKHEKLGEKCFICEPSLRDKDRLWCSEHDRYEDRCWLCYPEQQDKNRTFCKEHNLYENECFLCKPNINEKKIIPEKESNAKSSKEVTK